MMKSYAARHVVVSNVFEALNAANEHYCNVVIDNMDDPQSTFSFIGKKADLEKLMKQLGADAKIEMLKEGRLQ